LGHGETIFFAIRLSKMT